MKKLYLSVIFALLLSSWSFKSDATIVMIEVEDFEFDPTIFTVNQGDTILWFWEEGFHTTTSTTIPPGAATWDVLIDQTSQTFSYVATVPGSYDYECTFHASMGMLGHFTVTATTGISQVSSIPALSVNGSISSGGEITISYTLPSTGHTELKLYDLLGKPVKAFVTGIQQAGSHTASHPVPYLNRGIYFIELENSGARIMRRIVVQ